MWAGEFPQGSFDLETRFAPQLRALFRHLNVKKWSEPVIFSLLTWTCASRHNGVQFFISHLARWLRACRFSEPTFRPSGATNHWKNAVNRDSSFFSLFLFWSSHFLASPLWLFPLLSEVWLLNFLRSYAYCMLVLCLTIFRYPQIFSMCLNDLKSKGDQRRPSATCRQGRLTGLNERVNEFSQVVHKD